MDTLVKQWFVMRDLKRRNANNLAIHELKKAGLEIFTPMTKMVMNIGGRMQRREVPLIQDLLFVHEAKETVDQYVEKLPALQYRYLRGRSINDPMTVRKEEMERFIIAISNTKAPIFYKPGELTKEMYGKKVRIVGGVLDNFEGRLLSIKGKRKKHLIVELPDLVAAAVEVQPEFIQLL